MVGDSDTQFLIDIYSMEVTPNDCLSEVRSLLSCPSKIDAVGNLQGKDAQIFVDFLDRVLGCSPLDDKYRQRCSLLLSKICKACAIIPVSYILREKIHIERVYHRGRFADVSKGEYSGSTVAIKCLRVDQGEYERVFKRLCREVIGWKRLIHPNVLPLLGVSVAADRYCLEILTEWMPNGSLMEYAKSNPKANRLRLLSEVMSGVAYLHRLRIVHADLKGANVLVDLVGSTATARVADFGLTTMVDSSTNLLSESSLCSAGTLRWMSPELLDPKRFGSDGHQTPESDCYALGMVIYEVLTGHPPFHNMPAFPAVIAVVIDRKRPEKPPNAKSLGFSDALWELVQLCWSESSPTRPTAGQLFDDLSTAARTWVPPPVYPIEVDTGRNSITTGSSGSLGISLTNLVREA